MNDYKILNSYYYINNLNYKKINYEFKHEKK